MSAYPRRQQRPRWVTDDQGFRCRFKYCGGCRSWRPYGVENFAERTRRRVDGSLSSGWDARCRHCRREEVRERRARKTPEQRRAETREKWLRLKADPIALEARRKRNARYEAARRADPVKRAQMNENARRYGERLRADPERAAELRETNRMNYRMRAEREGRAVRVMSEDEYNRRYGKSTTQRYSMPEREVRVVARMLDAEIENGETVEQLAARAGLPTRRLWEVRNNHHASLYTIDRLCIALGTPMVEVYAA